MLSFLIALCRVKCKIQNSHFENSGNYIQHISMPSDATKKISFCDRVYFTKAVLKLPPYIIFILASTTATLCYSFHSGHPVWNSLDLHERLKKICFLKCTDIKRTVTATHNFQLFSHLIFVFIQVSWVNAVYFWWLTVHFVVCGTTPINGISAWNIYSNEFPKMKEIVNVKFT